MVLPISVWQRSNGKRRCASRGLSIASIKYISKRMACRDEGWTVRTSGALAASRSGRVELEAPQIFERVGEVIFERVEKVLGEALRAHAAGRRVEGLEQVV